MTGGVDSDVAFAGYRIVRDVPYAEFFGPHLPATIVTASECLGDPLPNAACTSWSRMTPAEHAKWIADHGFDASAFAELRAVVEDLLKRDELLWPDYVQSDAGIRRLAAVDAHVRRGTPRVLAIGLHCTSLERWRAEASAAEHQAGSLLDHLTRLRPMPAAGVALGWEPLCISHWEPGCSWHCNGLAKDFVTRTHRMPNRHGLIDDLDVAAELCQAITSEELGEPGLWLPWRLVDCSAAILPG